MFLEKWDGGQGLWRALIPLEKWGEKNIHERPMTKGDF